MEAYELQLSTVSQKPEGQATSLELPSCFGAALISPFSPNSDDLLASAASLSRVGNNFICILHCFISAQIRLKIRNGSL